MGRLVVAILLLAGIGWGCASRAPDPGERDGALAVITKKGDGDVATLVSPADLQEAYTRARISETIQEHLGGLKACYEWRLKRDPTLEGKIVVRFVIEPDGRVSDVAVREATLDDAVVQSCVVARLGRLVFPPPATGGTVTVNYPFVFKVAPGK